jgi:hypothetical protein
MMTDAAEMEHAANALRSKALNTRCSTEDSGGARCSADALPAHDHRYDREDFPDAA